MRSNYKPFGISFIPDELIAEFIRIVVKRGRLHIEICPDCGDHAFVAIEFSGRKFFVAELLCHADVEFIRREFARYLPMEVRSEADRRLKALFSRLPSEEVDEDEREHFILSDMWASITHSGNGDDLSGLMYLLQVLWDFYMYNMRSAHSKIVQITYNPDQRRFVAYTLGSSELEVPTGTGWDSHASAQPFSSDFRFGGAIAEA